MLAFVMLDLAFQYKAKRLARKNVFEMTYFVSDGTQINQSINQSINKLYSILQLNVQLQLHRQDYCREENLIVCEESCIRPS